MVESCSDKVRVREVVKERESCDVLRARRGLGYTMGALLALDGAPRITASDSPPSTRQNF